MTICRSKQGRSMIRVFIDGSCEPQNPGGTMGMGIVIVCGTRTICRTSRVVLPSEWEGLTSNNVAEYLALKIALKYLLDAGLQNEPIEIRSDSQLLIQQMFGTWKLKRGAYVAVARDVQALLKKFPRTTRRWIPRERNALADSLSRATVT
jgi:ribonuclease HI